VKLTINNLHAGYFRHKVLRDINLSVETGEVLCLLGPNGCGKTTLFKTILGLLPVVEGEMFADDRPLAGYSRAERARLIGYVPQIHIPPFPFTAFDVVLAGRTPCMGTFSAPSSRDRNAAGNAMDTMHIVHLADRDYARLSGGERQMVLIARALAQAPRFLVMDEPTSHLDFGNQARVMEMIRGLAGSEIGILFTTHAPDHAFRCASRVIALVNGSVAGYGRPFDVLTSALLEKMYGISIDVHRIMQNNYVCVPHTQGLS
jgi:iron complex transport system ATP-binding protein